MIVQPRNFRFLIFALALCASLATPTHVDALVAVQEVTTTNFSASTNHNANMPATVNAGDLLVAFVSYSGGSGSTANTPSGWTKTSDQVQITDVRGAIFLKDAVGNEDGTTVNFSTSGSVEATIQVARIANANWYGDILTGIATGTPATGDNGPPGTPNPPSLTPAWGSAENLWFAISAASNGVTAVGSYPSNYTGNQNFSQCPTTDACNLVIATRLLSATSDNPGTFSLSATENVPWVAQTLAVRPAAHGTLSKPPNNLGLVGYWSFDEGTSTRATDFSGNGNHTRFPGGGGNPTWTTGKRGSALSFDGNDVIQTNGEGNLDIQGSMTMSFWMKPRTTSNVWNFIAAKRDGAFSADAYSVELFGSAETGYCTADDNVFLWWTDPGDTFSGHRSNVSYRLNVWDHWTVVRNSGNDTVQFYRNGVDVGSTECEGGFSDPADTTAGNFSIGGSHYGVEEFFDGSIDELRVYNRALSASEVVALAKTGAVKFTTSSVTLAQGSTLANGLVGHWTFDGGDTNWVSDSVGTTTDRSGNGNHGGLQNMNRRTSVDGGKLGQALYFDGSDDYASMGNPSSLNLTTAGTVATWVKTRLHPSYDYGVIVSKFDWSGDLNGYILSYSTGQGGYRLGLADGATNQLINFGTPRLNEWQHVAYTWDGSFIRTYVDGESTGAPTAQTVTPDASSEPFYIGQDEDIVSYNMATIDDTRVYNRALTAAEVKQLYRLGQAKIQP